MKKILYPFQNRDLQFLYWAKAVSLFGTVLSLLVIPLYVYHQTKSGQILALTAFCESLGAAIAGFFLSHFSDRFPPKSFLIILDLISAIFILFFIYFFPVFLMVVYIAALGIGICGTLYICSSSKIITTIEKEEGRLRYIEGRFQIMNSAFQCSTPAIGGVLMHWISFQSLLWIDFASYLFSVLLISRLSQIKILLTPDGSKGQQANTSWLQNQLVHPLRYIKNSDSHKFLFLIAMLCAAAIGAGNAVYIFHVKSYLAGSDAHISWLLSLSFGASFLSALIVDRIKMKTFFMVSCCLGVMGCAYMGLSLAKSIWLFIFAYAFVDFMNVIYLVFTKAYLQNITASFMIGRLRGYLSALTSVGELLAMLFVTILISRISSNAFYFYGATSFFLASGIAVFAFIKLGSVRFGKYISPFPLNWRKEEL